MYAQYLLHGDSRRESRRQLDSTSTLHQLNGLFHLHFVVEGNELWLLGALACDQALLHVLLVEAVQSARRKGGTEEKKRAGTRDRHGRKKRTARDDEGLTHGDSDEYTAIVNVCSLKIN